jgi:hypothetical protein
MALRLALALFPCAVLVLRLRTVLGPGPSSSWAIPLVVSFANALLTVSVAREALGRRGFLAFWALYAFAWTAVAWHGQHFHLAPRPAALFMNLEEIAQTPLPGWSEIPWAIGGVALGLGWLARRPAPAVDGLRQAAVAAFLLFAGTQAATFVRYQTADMMRFSEYRDLVRTHGLEGAVVLDGLELLRGPGGAGILRELRLDSLSAPALPLPLDAVAADRIVIVQLESLDRDALVPGRTPNLLRLWEGATRGLVNPQRSSVSGSSSADFQVLTGLRPISAIPVYRLPWDHDASGLPAYAASRGFAFHAYHANDRHFWNRGPFFSALGARFHTAESIPEAEFSSWGRADGDLFRYAASRIRVAGRAVHFLITLSTHAPFDLVDPAAHLEGASSRTRYDHSVAYLDGALGRFLVALPKDGATLVALYSDHTSGLFDSGVEDGERPVPMMLGLLARDGSLAPLRRNGRPVREVEGVHELPALTRYLKDCLDASTR